MGNPLSLGYNDFLNMISNLGAAIQQSVSEPISIGGGVSFYCTQRIHFFKNVTEWLSLYFTACNFFLPCSYMAPSFCSLAGKVICRPNTGANTRFTSGAMVSVALLSLTWVRP